MTRKPDPERDTERRRDQRRLHQERLTVLARCTCSCHLGGVPAVLRIVTVVRRTGGIAAAQQLGAAG